MEGLLVLLALLIVAVIGLAIVGTIRAIIGTIRFVQNSVRQQPAAAVPKRSGDPELRDLEVTSRTILQMAARGDLDAETAERVGRCLAARHRALQAKPAVPAVRPARSVRAPAAGGTSVSPVKAAARTGETPVPAAAVPPAVVPSAAVHAAPVAPAPSKPPAVLQAPARPRRSLTNVLAAFMEERNILWGELTGGLLIVGCSIALVITLWHNLEELPYFPFLLFASITAALFGAGEYTLHHWKLESTSRGLLVIALLLVPLNLLVLADPSLGHGGPTLEWAFKAAALLLSVGMVRRAGRDLIGVGVLPGPIDRRWLFVLAVVGTAGSQLLVGLLQEEAHPLLFVALGCVPVACHLLACSAVVAGLARARRECQHLEMRQANALFVFLGLSSFALFVALGFLLSRSGAIGLTLPRLAEPFALASVPILAGGLLVWRGLPHEEAGPRTAGAAVAFTGLAFMLSAVVLAWPQPLPLLLVCLSNAALLTVLAFRWRMPYAHAVALPCLALAVLLVVQVVSGHGAVAPEELLGRQLAEQLTSPSSGIVLAILMVLAAAGSEALIRLGQRGHAASYGFGSGALGVCALLTTACHGIESPWPAAIVHGLSAVCVLTLYARWRRPALPYCGLGLFVAASLWGLWAMAPDNLALWGFVLALESLVLASAAVAAHPLRDACRAIAAVAAVLALGLALFAPEFPAEKLHTGTAALLALTAFVLAHLSRRLELTWLGSAFLFAAVSHLLIWDLDDWALPRPLLMALLAHATLALCGALLLQARRWRFWLVLYLPLLQSAVLTSLAAVPLLLVPGVAARLLAGYTLWLALVWLTIAILRRSPGWFSTCQMAVSGAVVFAVHAGLSEQDWFDPYSLQAYGIGLGLLGLGWIAARMMLSGNARVRELWEGSWPSWDRVMLGVLVAGQFALAVWSIAPGVVAEVRPAGYVSVVDWPSTVSHAYGPGAWGLLGILVIVLLAALREKGHMATLVELLVLAVTVPILAAGPFAAELATASALRWGLALCYLACSGLVWLRRDLARLATSAGVTVARDESAMLWAQGILAAVAASVFLVTMQVVLLRFYGLHPTGPAPSSLFAEIGWTLSHVFPLLVLMTGLLGHAVRERSSVYVFFGGLVANLAATLLACRLDQSLPPLWLAVIQANVLSSSLVTLVWLGVRRGLSERSPKPLLTVQAMLGLVIHTALLLLPLLAIYSDPSTPLDPQLGRFGSLAGWAALLFSAAAAYCQFTVSGLRGRIHILGIAGLSAGVLAACTISPWDHGDWRSFHVLQCCWCIFGLLAALAASVAIAQSGPNRLLALLPEYPLHRWLEGIGLAILALTLPSCWLDPLRPILPAAAVFSAGVLAGMLALWTLRPVYVWISGILIDFIGILFWLERGQGTAIPFLLTNALGLAVAAALWTVIGLVREPEERRTITRQPHSSFVAFAANTALGLVVLVVLLLLGSDLQPPRLIVSAVFAWYTLAAVGTAMIAALGDRHARFAPLGFYVLGLAAVGLLLHELTHSPSALGWWVALALASYAVLASFLALFFNRSREPWFLPAQAVTAGVVLVLSVWICLDFAARVDRYAGPGAVLLLMSAALLFSFPNSVWERRPRNSVSRLTAWLRSRETEFREAGSQTEFGNQKIINHQSSIINVVLTLGVVAAAEIAWACPDPVVWTLWLHRNVLLMVNLAGMTALYGVALPRWLAGDAEWVRCTRRSGPILGLLTSLILLILLVQEFRLYDPATRRTPMLGPEVLVVIAALVALMVSGIRFAVVPGRDPLGLSERGRTLYVYAVEVLLVLLFLHLRLNVPELFRGWAGKYWTLIVMLIAFIGVGLSEFFERRKLAVLAGPLQRTGVFVPLLPLLAFWTKPPAPLLSFADAHAPGLLPLLSYLDKLPQHFDSYAFLWLVAAGLYGLVFWTRRSFMFAVLAALAGNFALWSLLMHHGIAFLLHPQCWLIPPALIVLAAEYANRERLRHELSAGLRYLGICMIYVSSTADLFIAGLGNSVVLPIVLAVLSLAGILLGILIRVRAFLFLGISFLFLDVFTMIWYAAVDRYQTWLWWVSGIVLGAAILTLFAVFEKRRNDVLHMLEEIKRWD
jgi:hypothetical protein